MFPILLRLKKEAHRNIAKSQDIAIEELYKIFNETVLHGGTAIWRCYNGKRFSEGIDVYIPKDVKRIELLFSKLREKGFHIEKKKIGEHSLFSKLRLAKTIIRLEALFKKARGSLKEYETVDGNFITVYTLTPEEFIKEKIDTYKKRHKIRDLYDISYMLMFVKDKTNLKGDINLFIKNFRDPVDEEELRVLIIEGIIPSSREMLEYIKRSV